MSRVDRTGGPKPRMLVTLPLPDAVMALITTEYDALFLGGEYRLPTETLLAAAAGRDVLMVSMPDRLDAGVIALLPESVRAIATYSVGHEHIDLAAAAARGIAVYSTPDVLTEACAEIGLLLLLGAARRVTESIDLLRTGRWAGWSPVQLNGVGLSGKRLAIIGMGRIGRAVAARARAFGMQIHYTNRQELPPDLAAGAVYHPALADLLGIAQFLLLACPVTPATQGLLNAETLALLPRGAIIANIGRGGLVRDADLVAALVSGQVAAAGLDVFDGEPQVFPAYFDLPNLFMLPHIGSSTIETRLAMGQILLDGLRADRAGHRAHNRLV